jgi:hypothetical protein
MQMARGNGQQAKAAASAGKLSGYIKPKDDNGNAGGQQEWVDWGEVNPNLIIGAIRSVNKEGGAILFGHNRAKTMYAVTIFAGGGNTPYYFHCSLDGLQALEDFLMPLVELGNY